MATGWEQIAISVITQAELYYGAYNSSRVKDVHAPGFYLHLEPGAVFVGVGIWHPDTRTLNKIRDAIVDDPARWEAIRSEPAFTKHFELGGDSLKRGPKGYDPDHPFIEDIKRKDFIASTPFDEEQVCRPDFIDRFTDSCRTAAPFMEFLTAAVGLPW